MYERLENKFKITHPQNENATYSSLMNYSDDLEKPLQRWYRYKEGFSMELVENLIRRYNKNPNGLILDPFLGSGTTIIAANSLGLAGAGFEVNPFSYFLSKCKLRNYDENCIRELETKSQYVLERAMEETREYELPKLSIASNVFDQEVEAHFMTVKELISELQYEYKETQELLLLGWLSSIEELSNYRKAGNGLKKRRYVRPRVKTKKDVYVVLSDAYKRMIEDVRAVGISFDARIFNESCLNMRDVIDDQSVSGIIFSPPYANCFDYTEIYKLELWFGGFVKEYSDLRELRTISLRSHLNGKMEIPEDTTLTPTVKSLLGELTTKELWDQRIPDMLTLYFRDMFEVLRQAYGVLEDNGFCSIVVGNSSYGGVVFPTDLLLAEYAEQLGFIVDKIEVDRYIIPSSQQYEMTKQYKKLLRESVVCLVKKKTS